MTEPKPLRRRLRAGIIATLTLATALLAGPALAVDERDLLPVDEAFVLRADATDAGQIAIRWKIADGYYLYRHRISVQADAGFAAKPLQLPKGKAYKDEFFGDVETYRGSLTAALPGQAHAERTTLTIKYQGCADAGVCYPPQTRSVTVALPMAATKADQAPLVAFGNAGASGPPLPGGGLLGNRNTPGTDGLPLPPEQAFKFEAIAGDGNTLLLRFTPARGYYLYRDKTVLKLAGPGIGAGNPQWPRGTAHRDEYFGATTVYFDQIDVPLPLQRTRADGAEVQLTATFQGCQTDGICYPPMTRTVTVAVPRGTVTPATDSPSAMTGSTPDGSTRTGDAVAASGDGANTAAPANTTPTGSTATSTAGAVSVAAADGNAAADGSTAGPGPDTPGNPQIGLTSALLLALLGGLVLNLMPCVLPVLSLKALSLAGNGQDPMRARRHALWYTAGVLLSFAVLGATALALRHAGLALGWGFQLQQPVVVAVLALLMFGLGLSLSGVWHIGGRWTGAGHALTTQSGPTGDFFTGVLAVVVATPCTAPFMGAALAWAFTASPATAMAVFVALGVGLALPFLLIGFVPALAHLLPRPGAWMETFKQLLAFPLYLTAAWLAWVLGRQRGADAIGWWLLAAILLAFGVWAWTRARRGSYRWSWVVVALAVLALAWPLRVIHTLPRPLSTAAVASPASGVTPVPFSEQRLTDLRAAGRVVFVNVTADWCVTCKAAEKAVFAREGFRQALDAADAVYMVGDWTDVDPALTAFLQRHNAYGVPLYVVFPRGNGEGRVLPTVLTADTAYAALAAAAKAAP